MISTPQRSQHPTVQHRFADIQETRHPVFTNHTAVKTEVLERSWLHYSLHNSSSGNVSGLNSSFWITHSFRHAVIVLSLTCNSVAIFLEVVLLSNNLNAKARFGSATEVSISFRYFDSPGGTFIFNGIGPSSWNGISPGFFIPYTYIHTFL